MSKIALEGNASGTGTFTIASPNSNSNYTLTLPSSTGTVVVTGGAQTIEFAAGTAASPSITFTGDTNTGIFSPGADTIAFSEGGAEAMRIDSSGRFLVGTTTARTVYTGYTPAIQIEGTTASTASMSIIRNSNDAQEATLFFAKSRGTTNGSSTVVQNGDLLGQVVFNGADGSDTNSIAGIISCNVDGTPGNNDMPGRLTFATTADGSDAPTERMRIDSSGNVFVGGTANLDSNKLNVLGAKTISSGIPQAQLAIGDTTTLNTGTGGGVAFLAKYNANDLTTMGSIEGVRENATSGNYAGALVFKTRTNGSDNFERARITSGGAFLVGATSASTPAGSTSYIVSQGDFSSVGGVGFGMSVASTTGTGEDHYYISFQTATTTQRGYIYYNNGAGQVQLSATSDARLKENIVDAPSALPVLEQVKVRQYDWKETGNTNIGFVAQELHEVIPRAVAVGQDNEDGTIKMAWGVDNASLVPYLVKAIQELKTITDAQTTRIEALEAEVAALKGQ